MPVITTPQNVKGQRGEGGGGLGGGGLGGGGTGRGHREAERLGDPLQLVLTLLEDLDDRSRSRFWQENEPGRTETAVATAAGRGREGGGGAGSTQATWRRLLALLLGDEVHLVHEAEDLRRLRVLTHRSEACARERGGVSDAPARHHALLSESRAGPSRRTRAGACSHEA